MSELKPCPFCGKTAYPIVDDETETKFGVKCFNCGGAIDPEYGELDDAFEAWNRRVDKTASDEKAVFDCIANCEIASYTTMDVDNRIVVSASEIANILLWTKYRVRKAIKYLVSDGLIERASVGRPAIESCGESRELVCDAMPPKNGYALTPKGFRCEEWKALYAEWCKSMEEWANSKEE